MVRQKCSGIRRSYLVATGLVWLAVPVFLVPEYVLMLGSLIIGVTVSVAIGTFKKYL